jgi:two-component system sensor histidine kinase RegB
VTPLIQDAPSRLDDEARRINLSWLLRLRWFAVVGQLLTILCADRIMGMELPLWPLLVIVGIAAASNLWCASWMRRGQPVREALLAWIMSADIVLLTGLLYFTGGPFNPFSVLYVVHIALSAVVLRAFWTWLLFALSFACFGALFLEHVWLKLSWFGTPLSHADHMRMHLHGMWIAFGVAASLIAYFVNRIARDLAAREHELVKARVLAHRSEKLASLATLAAGAAHELSSPLATIAVVAKELELQLDRELHVDAAAADARLIRTEVERCRAIIVQMAADAGQSSGEASGQIRLRELIERALESLPQRSRVELSISESVGESSLVLPVRAVTHAVRGVIKNALEAAPEQPVSVRVEGASDRYCIHVNDAGPGVPPEVLTRLGEPFFTTKPVGQGMGLGLFLTRAVLERLGGNVSIKSDAAHGTSVALSLPKGRVGVVEAGAFDLFAERPLA